MSYLQITSLCKSYADGESPVPVLAGLSYALERGESVAVCGASGSGKSTLLQIIAGLLAADSGSVKIGGAELLTLTEPAKTNFRRKHIGLVFQNHRLLPQLTALENVLLPTLALPKPEQLQYADLAQAQLKDLGLDGKFDRFPAQLSGGECQRVAIARALILSPGLLLADEPTGALDPKTAEHLLDVWEELRRRQNLAVIVATHSEAVARRMGNILTLRQGQLQA